MAGLDEAIQAASHSFISHLDRRPAIWPLSHRLTVAPEKRRATLYREFQRTGEWLQGLLLGRSPLRKSEELFYIVISEMLGRSIFHQSDLGERRGFFFFRARMNHISYVAF